MTASEAGATTQEMRKTGASYNLQGLGIPGDWGGKGHVNADGGFAGYYGGWSNAYGIRPVVMLTKGVYIESGDGTEENPYVLGKE